jgi:hypothetical protein
MAKCQYFQRFFASRYFRMLRITHAMHITRINCPQSVHRDLPARAGHHPEGMGRKKVREAAGEKAPFN